MKDIRLYYRRDCKGIEKIENTLAFMFESRSPWVLTEEAEKAPFRQNNYLDCWKNLPKGFKGPQS